jgi:hypothetical protein
MPIVVGGDVGVIGIMLAGGGAVTGGVVGMPLEAGGGFAGVTGGLMGAPPGDIAAPGGVGMAAH